MTTILLLFWGFAVPPFAAFSVHLAFHMARLGSYRGLLGAWFAASLSPLIGGLIAGRWLVVAGGAVNMIIVAWLWNRRKRRKRAPRLAGYKARAALAKLLQRAREAARPRPVLRPAPGGAR